MAKDRAEDGGGGAGDEIGRSLARVIFAGAKDRTQAEAILRSFGVGLSRNAGARYWVLREQIGGTALAQRVVEALTEKYTRQAKYCAEVEAVAASIAARLTHAGDPEKGGVSEKDQTGLVQRYIELMKCLREMARETGERKRGEGEVDEGPTLAALLGDDELPADDGEDALRDAARKAAAATGTLFEASGAARSGVGGARR
jgi:hypothetical protein